MVDGTDLHLHCFVLPLWTSDLKGIILPIVATLLLPSLQRSWSILCCYTFIVANQGNQNIPQPSWTMLVLISVSRLKRVNLDLQDCIFRIYWTIGGLNAAIDHLYLFSSAFSPLLAFLRFYCPPPSFITDDQVKAKITVFFPLLRLHRLPKAWNKQDFWPWSEAAALFISSCPTARVFHSFLISPSLPSPLSYFSCTCGRH